MVGNLSRAMAAVNYCTENRKELDVGTSGIIDGEKGAIISRHLVRALYRIYVIIPIERIDEKIPVNKVLEMAEEQRVANEPKNKTDEAV